MRCCKALAEGNLAYERRFGHIFIVCATGRSSGGDACAPSSPPRQRSRPGNPHRCGRAGPNYRVALAGTLTCMLSTRSRLSQPRRGELMRAYGVHGTSEEGQVFDFAPDVVRVAMGIANTYLVGHATRWVLVDTGPPGLSALIRRAAPKAIRCGREARRDHPDPRPCRSRRQRRRPGSGVERARLRARARASVPRGSLGVSSARSHGRGRNGPAVSSVPARRSARRHDTGPATQQHDPGIA